MEAIYVLSDPDSSKEGKYKVGITGRSKDLLLRDYRRSRPEVILYLFENCSNNKILEKCILDKFARYRIPHESGTLSEWVQMDVKTIINEINELLKEEKYKIRDIVENEYTIKDFINGKCNYNWSISESCKDLYDEYINSGGKLNKLNFCRLILNEISAYHKYDKKQIKIKKNKLTYYKGIQLKKNVIASNYNYNCNII